MIFSHLSRFGAACALPALLGLGMPATADVPESQEPIKIAVQEAAGQYFNAHILGRVLQEAGYNVEYVSAGYYPQVQGVADGDIDMALGLWSSNIGEGWMELFDSGQVLDAGEIGYMGVETWYANDAALAACPGIETDIMVLNDCAQALATAETFPKGRLLDYPIEWGTSNELRIAALDLPLVSQPAGSEGALVAELNSAIERKAPLVMMFWAPHWSLLTVEYGWIDMPEDLVNKYSLQKPRVFKAGWPGMFDKWPVAARFIQNFTVDNATQELLMGQVDNDGMDLMEATGAWIDANPGVWQPMVDKAMEGS